MTISELVNTAKFGELRNLGLGESAEEAIVSYINLGMIELYKRFRLSTKEVVIELHSMQDEYELPADCMWLISAYDEVPPDGAYGTTELSINNEDDPLTINTVGWNKVQVPIALTGGYISLVYAAGPQSLSYAREAVGTIAAGKYWKYITTIDSNGLIVKDPITRLPLITTQVEVVHIELPMQMIEALLHYVGYRAHGAMDGSIQAENNTHYMRFDAACKRIEQSGMMTNDNLDMDYRIWDKGFV